MSKLDFLSARPSLSDGFDPTTGRFMEPVIRAHFGDWQDIGDPDGDADLAVLKSVRDQAEAQHRAMFETLVAVGNDDDPSLNRDGRTKIAAKILEPKLRVLADVAEREFARANAAIEQESAKVAKAVRVADPLDIAVHSDIRAHLARMEPAARNGAVTMATINGDVRTLQAIATAPAYLSGLAEDGPGQIYQRAQERLAELMAPAETRRIARLRQGLAMSAQAVSVLDRTARKLIDFNKAQALIERESKRTHA